MGGWEDPHSPKSGSQTGRSWPSGDMWGQLEMFWVSQVGSPTGTEWLNTRDASTTTHRSTLHTKNDRPRSVCPEVTSDPKLWEDTCNWCSPCWEHSEPRYSCCPPHPPTLCMSMLRRHLLKSLPWPIHPNPPTPRPCLNFMARQHQMLHTSLASSLEWNSHQGREPFIGFGHCFVPRVWTQQVPGTWWLNTEEGPSGPSAQQLPSRGDGLWSLCNPNLHPRPNFLMGTWLSGGSPWLRDSAPCFESCKASWKVDSQTRLRSRVALAQAGGTPPLNW